MNFNIKQLPSLILVVGLLFLSSCLKETAAGETLDAKIDYHNLSDKYIASVPSRIVVSSAGKTYRERSTEVNQNGEITEITLSNAPKAISL